MSDVLIVRNLSEGPKPARGLAVISCHQHPRALDGMRVDAIHATESAVEHPAFSRIALTLLRSQEKRAQKA